MESTFTELPIRMFIGGISGMTATSLLQPIDTVKVLLQTPGDVYHSKNPYQIMKQLYKTEGISGFYKGLTICLVKTIFIYINSNGCLSYTLSK